jgi:ABC-2 type transport system permease protein
MGATRALARRALGDSPTRVIAFALLFFFAAYAQPTAYESAYPTHADRVKLAASFGENQAVRMLYGKPHDLLTTGGYVEWRLGALPIFAAVWGFLAAIRAMRTEEETGRQELVLSGVVGRPRAFVAALVAIGVGALILWLALFLALVAGGLPAGGSAGLALALMVPVPVFAGVGALASQLAPTRRLAMGLSAGVLGAAFLLRVVADTTDLDWLTWATPLGWAGELRPFTGWEPWVLVLPVVATVLLLLAAERIFRVRDIGSGLLPSHDTSPPRLWLLSSPLQLAARSELGTLLAWVVGVGVSALIMGVVADSVANAGISEGVQDQVAKLGTGSIATATGYLSFAFLFFIFAASLFVCMQMTAARREEAEQRLETLFSLPVGRRGWLAGRLLLGVAGAALIALTAALLTWIGAVSSGVDISFWRMLEAGANCLPASLLFMGLAALAFAVVPKATAGIGYGLVSVAFLWETIGAIAEVPKWLLDLSPFHHIGMVPAEPFRLTAAVVMVAIAAVAGAAAIGLFARRDLTAA